MSGAPIPESPATFQPCQLALYAGTTCGHFESPRQKKAVCDEEGDDEEDEDQEMIGSVIGLE